MAIRVILFSLFILRFSLFTANAYRIEIINAAIANMPVFLAGYYGDHLAVIDSVAADEGGRAVFERNYDLYSGIYTLITPGKLSYDLLLDADQQLRMEWLPTGEVSIDGDEKAAEWAAYQTWAITSPDRAQLVERRRQIINQYPGTFLAAYLTALQPIEPPNVEATGDINQLMQTYQYHRRHFFNNMPLSDVRLLRTPLYHEKIHYFISRFVTQQTDSLIRIAYRMLEQASGNYETFFYVSDFLIDYSLRNYSKIKDINKLHNFVNRNRDMLGSKGQAMLPPRININYFKVSDEKTLQNRLENMPFTDIDGQTFDVQTIRDKFRVYYFWKNNCPRCIADVARWQTVLSRHVKKSCSGIAVNINNDVQPQENRILAYDPQCINVSIANAPWCETVFFANLYSKIVVTDVDGNILGIFASAGALDNFLRIAR